MVRVYTQNREKADQAFKNFSFIKASSYYQDLVDHGYDSGEIYTNLGDSYYYNAKYQQASQCYSHVFKDSAKSVSSEYYFRYAQTLNHLGDCQKAETVMKMYFKKEGKKDRSEDWNPVRFMETIKQHSGRYNFKAVELNSLQSDFGTAFYGSEKVIYTSAKDTGIIIKRRDSWNEKSFLKLYEADISASGGLKKPKLLKGEVNTNLHQSSPAITKDGRTMYFTRSNFINGKQKAGKKGTTHLKIYSAQNSNGIWTNIKELNFPINSDGFSSAHPALSPDEKELYFVSDRANNFGNSDLYVVSHKPDGFIGNDVTRLNDEINTPGRETYPFVGDDGVLYFSSDGHPGLGGLDIYAAVKDEKGNYHIINMGSEINSAADDFAFVINEKRKGYFSTNRGGNDDIYAFTENKPVNFGFDIHPIVFGTLKNEKNGEPIANGVIEIYDENNKKCSISYTDKDGRYTVVLQPFKYYKLHYSKEGMAGKIKHTEPLKPLQKKEMSFEFLIEMEVKTEKTKETLNVGDDLAKKLNLPMVYFDYNGQKVRKSSKAILNKIIEFLKERPNISLKINSYTDSRGNDDFNFKLSNNRAEATVEYLVQNGIHPDRLISEGFGETRLLNNCDNGTDCTEEEHKLNRRSEFIIIAK